MSAITPSIPPGLYLTAQNVTFEFGPEVTGVMQSTGGVPPSISKYIAYDGRNPPKPFIAVTEDGRGRVVYDGGFPKFYNATWNNATTFEGLITAAKYLYNAIHWVANPEKVAAGNKKILVMDDSVAANSYGLIRTSTTHSFNNNLTKIIQLAGFVPTILPYSSMGSAWRTLAQLEEYAAVIFLGTAHSTQTAALTITTAFVNNLVTYRENGNGLILITDGGATLSSATQASTTNYIGFTRNINRIAARFGAYFSGDLNKVTTTVGHLRQNYGDHPLFNNIADSESVPAGGSESDIVVDPASPKPVESFQPITLNASGDTQINLLVTLADGSVVTARYLYSVGASNYLMVNNSSTLAQLQTNKDRVLNLTVGISSSAAGTVWGEILRNGKRIGEFTANSGNTTTTLYAGALTTAAKGDTVVVRVVVPTVFEKQLTVDSFDNFDVNAIVTEAAAVSKVGIVGGNWGSALIDFMKKTTAESTIVDISPDVSKAVNQAKIRNYALGRFKYKGSPFTANISDNLTMLNMRTAGINSPNNKHYIDAETGAVYAYLNGAIRLMTGTTAIDLYPGEMNFVDEVTSQRWTMNSNGIFAKTS